MVRQQQRRNKIMKTITKKMKLVPGKKGQTLFCPMLDWMYDNDDCLEFPNLPQFSIQISPLVGKSPEWPKRLDWETGNVRGWEHGHGRFTFILREKEGKGDDVVYHTLGFFASKEDALSHTQQQQQQRETK